MTKQMEQNTECPECGYPALELDCYARTKSEGEPAVKLNPKQSMKREFQCSSCGHKWKIEEQCVPTDLEKLMKEWRELNKKTTPIAQRIVPGKPLSIIDIDPNDLVRRHELAKILHDNISELDLDPIEHHELFQDVK
ncbi:MAG: hypothetical protein KJ687_00850 [Proteobacteria bacterium]|nr:hypothetical protein [Pseudomonadota bacterium]